MVGAAVAGLREPARNGWTPRRVSGSDGRRQIQFINKLFGVVA